MHLLGHDAILNRLLTLAREGAVSHAYLFMGPSGIGKRTTALHFARQLEQGAEESERPLADLVAIEPEEGSIGIDAVREFHEKLLERPQQGPYRVGILSAGHRMTPEAQNALLKLAEEPPSQAVLIVTTFDPEALFDTVRSRLQSVTFSPIPEKEVADWLQKTHKLAKKDAEKYAQQSGGRPGLALRLATDESLQALQDTAQALLRASSSRDRTALIKQVVEDETPLTDILDALIREISYTVRDDAPRRLSFWHNLLALRQESRRGSLNTRLQLEALFAEQ